MRDASIDSTQQQQPLPFHVTLQFTHWTRHAESDPSSSLQIQFRFQLQYKFQIGIDIHSKCSCCHWQWQFQFRCHSHSISIESTQSSVCLCKCVTHTDAHDSCQQPKGIHTRTRSCRIQPASHRSNHSQNSVMLIQLIAVVSLYISLFFAMCRISLHPFDPVPVPVPVPVPLCNLLLLNRIVLLLADPPLHPLPPLLPLPPPLPLPLHVVARPALDLRRVPLLLPFDIAKLPPSALPLPREQLSIHCFILCPRSHLCCSN